MATPTEELARPYCDIVDDGKGFEFDCHGLQAFREAVEAESDAERMKQPAVGHFDVYNGDSYVQVKPEFADETTVKLYAQPFPSTEQLQQRVKELTEALRPFAGFACGCGKCYNCIAEKALANTQGDSK